MMVDHTECSLKPEGNGLDSDELETRNRSDIQEEEEKAEELGDGQESEDEDEMSHMTDPTHPNYSEMEMAERSVPVVISSQLREESVTVVTARDDHEESRVHDEDPKKEKVVGMVTHGM